MRKFLLLILFLWALPSFAQNPRYDGVIQSRSGAPAGGASVAVCSQPATLSTTPCSPLAPLCSSALDTSCTSPNPVQADGLGNFHFYAKNNGFYTLQFYGSSLTTYSQTDVQIGVGSSAALQPAVSDLVFYVSQAGSDFNTGGSIGTAFGTLAHANAVAIANGGGTIIESGTISFSSPLVLGSNSGGINRNVALDCMGVPGLANNAAGVLNYTGTSGIALTMNQGVYDSKRCRLQGPGTGTAQGLFLGQTTGGAQSNNFFSSHLEDWTITGFPGGGLIVGFYVYIDQLQNVYVQNNGGLDLQWASTSTSGENISWTGGAVTESGSSFNTSCALISGSIEFRGVSFDQCGMTVSVASGNGPAHVDCNPCHFENSGSSGATTADFVTITGTGATVFGCWHCTLQEDGSGAGRTEFFKVNSTGSADVINIIGGQYTSQESGIPLINNTATAANIYCFGQEMLNLNACSNNYGTLGFAASPNEGIRLSGTGNAYLKPAASDGKLNVSTLGTDSTTCGLSWSTTACLTIQQAITNLNATNIGGDIYVGCGTFTTSTQIVISGRIKVIGCGRANAAGGNGTLIKASASFPASTAVVALGVSGGDFGDRLENVSVNCNDITGSIGVQNNFAEEQSGADHVLVNGCLAEDFDWEGASAQNSFLHDIEALTDSSVGASWLGIKVSGTTGFRGIDGATVNGAGAGTQPIDCMSTSDAGLYQNIHVESCGTGILVNSSSGVTLSNFYGGPNMTTVIELASGVQEFNGNSLLIGSATNLIKNDANSSFTSTASALSFYLVGNGATPPVLLSVPGGTFTFSALSLLSSSGGSILHQAPNTAATITVTDPVATTATPVVGTCTMTTTTCTITVVSGASHCVATDSGGTIAGQCAIAGTTLTVTAASSNTSTWSVLWW